jgi:hypothetical protein
LGFTGPTGSKDAEVVQPYGSTRSRAHHQMMMIDDYTYAGFDFRGDPDFAFPEDAQWGDLGKKHTFCSF